MDVVATITFDLPGLPPSANKRLHHMKRAKANKEWKGWSQLAALDAVNRSGMTDLPWDRAHVQYVFHYPKVTHADLDNLLGSAKPVLDGTKGIIVTDDSASIVHRVAADIKVTKGVALGMTVIVEKCDCS